MAYLVVVEVVEVEGVERVELRYEVQHEVLVESEL